MHSILSLFLASSVVASALALAGGAPLALQGCTADEDCILAHPTTPRCLQAPAGQGGSACTLDYAYNETGFCACAAQACVDLSSPNKTSLKQWLMIGDSISLGYEGAVAANVSGEYEVVHAPSFPGGNGNNDNAFWQSSCAAGWLGTDPSRWDAVTINAGLHDLAYPDNEHLSVATYAQFVGDTLRLLARSLRPGAVLVWNRITPVPTNPPPACILIPGRLESDVEAYNAVADAVVASLAHRVAACDLHRVKTDTTAWATLTALLRNAPVPILQVWALKCWGRL